MRTIVYDRKCSNSSCRNVLPFQGLHRGFINFLDNVAELGWLYKMHIDEFQEGTSIHGLQVRTQSNYNYVYGYVDSSINPCMSRILRLVY